MVPLATTATNAAFQRTQKRTARALLRQSLSIERVLPPVSGLAASSGRHHENRSVCVASLPASEQLQHGAVTHSVTKRPPIYRVMLHNDDYNKREYVVKVLVKVVEGMGVDDAIQVMQEAHDTGVAMVQACPQDEAEQCCECLRLSGLSSTIEPGC